MRRLVLAGLLLAFFAMRGIGLSRLPIFLDESVHVCWAVRFAQEPGFWKPLEDGKLLHIAATSLIVPYAADPLAAGRFASVLVGALALVAAYGIGRRLFGTPVGITAAALYLLCPFAVVYDRMLLADVYLSSATALTLLGTVSIAQRPTPRRGVVVGLGTGAAIVAKIPGLIVLAFPVLGVLLLGRDRRRALPALAAAYATCLAVAAGPVAYFFVHSTQLAAKADLAGTDRLGLLVENLGLGGSWLLDYFTPPVFVIGALALLAGVARGRRPEMLLALASVLPVLAFALAANDWFPRYLFFVSVPFLVLVARGLVAGAGWLRARLPARAASVAPGLIGLVVLAPSLRFDLLLLTDPAQAPWPGPDRFQYVLGWPSGYGWVDAAGILRRELVRHPEGISVAGDQLGHETGNWAVRALFINEPRLEIETMGLRTDEAVAFLERSAARRPTFVLLSRRPQYHGTPHYRVQPLAGLRKPDGDPAGALLRLVPRATGPAP